MKCSQKIAALYRQQLLRLLLHKRLTLDENNQIYAFTISYFFHSFLSHRARYFCHCNSYVEDERDSSFENREEKCYFKMFVVVFVEFKKGFELWDRESVKQDPFSCSPPLFALFRDLAGREELYIPYLQHFEPSLLSVNWFQTLSPNGISGISIRSHLVKPGHKTRGPVCVTSIRTYIVVTCWRIRINLCDLHSLRIAINFSDLRLLLFPRFDIYSRRCGIALSVGSTPSSRILIGKILFSDLRAILN